MGDVELRRLIKRYGQTMALDDVSLNVADGELLVLLGPSGSGKSTILKLIAGIDAPSSGEIWLDRRRIDPLLPRLRDVAMVFQSYALYPHMSVAKNLEFPLETAGMRRAQIRERVAEVALLLGLEKLLNRRPGQLSGGQQQRVALGRAIVRRPKLFLMDEPLSNLDAQLRVKTRLDLVALHERLNATTIYVTHDQAEAMSMGDRIAVIHSGRLRQVGPPEEVYEHPADLVVAGFLGSPSMNFLPAQCDADGGQVGLSGAGFEMSIARAELASVCRDGRENVTLGVRPEYLMLEPAAAGGVVMEARIRRVELQGHERLVHMTVGQTDVIAFAPIRFAARAGDIVSVTIRTEGLRLFDVASGRALPRSFPEGEQVGGREAAIVGTKGRE